MTVYAEQVNYWNTSKKSPDKLLTECEKMLTDVKATILTSGILKHQGNTIVILEFALQDAHYRMEWKPLRSKTKMNMPHSAKLLPLCGMK